MKQKNKKLVAKKHLGQNWLDDPATLIAMCEAADVQHSDFVLEVGPGPGSLTRVLLSQAKKVFAVEKDDRFRMSLELLRDSESNFDYIIGDILTFDIDKRVEQEKDFKVVANIPYYITSEIIAKLIALKNKPKAVALMTQKEVAQSLADPKRIKSVAALILKCYATAEYVRTVPAILFTPQPKVDSAILKLTFLKKPLHDILSDNIFLSVAKAAYRGKRKMLSNSLASNLKLSSEDLNRAFTESKVSKDARPENLTLTEWKNLVQEIKIRSL